MSAPTPRIMKKQMKGKGKTNNPLNFGDQELFDMVIDCMLREEATLRMDALTPPPSPITSSAPSAARR